MTDETLTLAFKHYRSFNKAKVIRERWNNKTKGYGFVSFSDSADMVACMKSMNGVPQLHTCPRAFVGASRSGLSLLYLGNIEGLSSDEAVVSLGAGKYIGNRPCKLRKSTWKERSAVGGKSMGPSKKSRGNKHMSKRFKGTMTH